MHRGLSFRVIQVGLLVLIGGSVWAAAPGTAAWGHGIFKKTLEKKYGNLRVTCNMCHVKKESKEQRNEFGKLFYDQLLGQDLSARWKAVEGDERKALETEVMAPAILVALEKIEKQENEEGQLYGELIPAGAIEGSKLKKGGDSDADDDDDDDG